LTKRKRHTVPQIRAKLEQGQALAKQGIPQSEIAQILGVSVMTYHRWKKSAQPRLLTLVPRDEEDAAAIGSGSAPDRDYKSQVSELLIENAKLSKLVIDLLLEKMRLQDEANGRTIRPASSQPRPSQERSDNGQRGIRGVQGAD
jgi:hypothetical protein